MNPPVSGAITRKSASNLALAFVLLPAPKRRAMTALYAFCREVDDVADEETRAVAERRESLRQWREDIRTACTGGSPRLAVNRELQPYINEYRLPLHLFEALLDGVEMDLEPQRYADPKAVEQYCYLVASVVGLLSIEVFGYTQPGCRDYALALGKALQLTNILRDIGNDAQRGRIYLPESDLAEFGVTREEILARRPSERFQRLCARTAGRAREFYAEARRVLPRADRRSMVAAELMGAVYWQLLRRLERRSFPVLGDTPVRLAKGEKLGLIALAWLRLQTGLPFATYGA